MMNIYIITPFPNAIEVILNTSMLNKAFERGKVKYHLLNLFDFTNDRIDDSPFGGGEGMIIKPDPIFRAYESINKKGKVIFPTPDGKLFNHELALDLSIEKTLIFICGHYKGIDQRIRNKIVTDEISMGDFVLTSGELPTLMIIDSVVRLIPGVLNDYESARKDSFYYDLLDGPHYTRPRNYRGMKVPNILLSGDHKKINDWFLKQRIKKTKIRRKDLLNEDKSY